MAKLITLGPKSWNGHQRFELCSQAIAGGTDGEGSLALKSFRPKVVYEISGGRTRSGNGVRSWRTSNRTASLHGGASDLNHLPGSSVELEEDGDCCGKDASSSTEAVSLSAEEIRKTTAQSAQVVRLWFRWRDRVRVTPRARGIILMNILTFLYGSNIVVVKEAQEILTPAAFAAGRFAVASLVFLPVGWEAWKDGRIRSAGLELGVWATLGYFTQSVGVLTTDAGRASFISMFTVIVVPLLAGLSGAKIPNLTWLAAAAALLGVGMLELSGTAPTVGDLYNFISAVMFGIGFMGMATFANSFKFFCIWFGCEFVSSGKHVDVLSMSWDGCWNCFRDVPVTAMLYTGLLTTALCLWLEVVSMRDVSATEAAMIYTLEPLWGAAFAWYFLGERWGPSGWLGATFILGGSLMVQLFGSPTKK